MKTSRLLCFGLMLLAGTGTGMAGAGAELPPAREPAELRTEPDDPPLVKYDGRGKLLFQELYQDGFPADWHQTFVYYPHGSRYGVKLQRNIRAINVFLAAEVRRPKTVRIFLKEYLLRFLSDNMEEGAPQLIDQAGIDENIDDYFVDKDSRSATAARRAQLKAKLEGYARSPYPIVKDNGWILDVNLVVYDGAVEHWLVKGWVTPLQIDSFLWEFKEPKGTFKPLTLTR